MPKRTQENFVTNNPKAKRTAIGVSLAGIPKGPMRDKNRKALPTPYALALDWLAKTLTGDWTSIKEGNAFIILVVTDTDGSHVLKKFGGGGAATKSKIADKSYSVSYRAATLAELAKDAGYAVTLDPPRRP